MLSGCKPWCVSTGCDQDSGACPCQVGFYGEGCKKSMSMSQVWYL